MNQEQYNKEFQDKIDSELEQIEKETNKELKLLVGSIFLLFLNNQLDNPTKFLKNDKTKMFENEIKRLVEKNKKIQIKKINESIMKISGNNESIRDYRFKGFTASQRIEKMFLDIEYDLKQTFITGHSMALNKNNVKRQFNNIYKSYSNRLKTIQNTELARAKNQALIEEFKKSFNKIQIVAVRDKRTSEICKNKDGKIYDIDKLTQELLPPFHPNCRTTIMPI